MGADLVRVGGDEYGDDDDGDDDVTHYGMCVVMVMVVACERAEV